MRVAVLLVATACGRIDFGTVADAGASATGDTLDAADAGPDARTFSCAGYLICDDFEGSIGPEWTADLGVALDTTTAHRGASSVRMRMPALQAGEDRSVRLVNMTTLATVPAALWVRGWFRASGLPVSTNALELISIDRDGGGPAADYVFLRSDRAQVYNAPSLLQDSTSAPAPLDTWFCVAFEVQFATSATGSLEMTSDILDTISLTGVATNDATEPVDGLGVGPYFTGTNVDVPQPSFDIWVDDLIVHTSEITCDD